jgi:hypothetical protein
MTHQPCALSSLRQAAKASVLHTDIPRFESWSEHQSSRSSMAERPADNRKTAVRYRAGEPVATGDHLDHDRQIGAAHRRISILDGPGAFKPETVGQRVFNPRARGSTPPGSSNRTITHTRLAQSVERRPLKSEVRGSSPRSCTILFEQDSRLGQRHAIQAKRPIPSDPALDLRRICRGGPAVHGLRRVRFPCRSPASTIVVHHRSNHKGGLP